MTKRSALAVIHLCFRTHDSNEEKRHPRTTSLQLAVSRETLKSEAATRWLAKRFHEHQVYLHELPRVLFDGLNTPSLEGIHQGHVGDCYLVSTLGGMVHMHAPAVRRMIEPRFDGSYVVRCFDGRTVDVPPVTDGMILLESRAGPHQGMWLHVLDAAYGLHRMTEGSRRNDPDGLPEDTLSGGSPARVMRYFIGRKPQAFVIPIHDPDPRASERKMRSLIAEGVLQKWIINGHDVRPDRKAPAMSSGHCYAILDYDKDRDRVLIWNPHGNNFTPKGPEGLANGYVTQNGQFWMPLKEFAEVYRRIDWDSLPDSARN